MKQSFIHIIMRPLLGLALCSGAITACTPDDEDHALGPRPGSAAFTVQDISTPEMRNAYRLESTTEGAFVYQWDLGNGTPAYNGNRIDTVYFEEKGSYNIKLTILTDGGHAIATQSLVVEEDAATGTNAVTGSEMNNESDWTFISTGSTQTDYAFQNGALTFTNANPAQTNIAMWQAVELKGGRAYEFSADVKGSGMQNSWMEVLLLKDEPEDGKDPSASAFAGLNTWTGCGTEAFDGSLATVGCLGDGRVNVEESGTYYLVVKVGSWDGTLGTEGLTIDNIKLIAQARLAEGNNILEGSTMDDASVWTISDMGLALTDVAFQDGKMKFTNANPSQTNVGVWQAVDVAANQIYKLKATVDKAGATNSWVEFYISPTKPTEGSDYTTGRIEPGSVKSFSEAGTVYVLVKVGSWDGTLGPNGVTVDDVALVEMY